VDTGSGDARRVIHHELANKGIGLVVSRLKREGRDAPRANGVYERIGADRFFPRVQDAVDGVAAEGRRRSDGSETHA
jgi:hypothetical protein